MASRRNEIIAINKRTDIDAQEKTRLIQALFTPDIQLHAQSSIEAQADDGYENLYDSMTSIVQARQEDTLYEAVGVHVTLLPDVVADDDFCAFSRHLLTQYKHVGSIVVSLRGGGAREWIQLCNNCPKGGSLVGCHFFCVEYLVKWIEEKGCEYIECPMCRRGTSQRKKIAEQEIETMEQLMSERDNFKGARDDAMMTFKEIHIAEKACTDYWSAEQNFSRKKLNEDALTEVFTNWERNRNFEDYRVWLENQATVAIKANNVVILSIIISHYQARNQSPSDNWSALLQVACSQNNPDAVDILLSSAGAQVSRDCACLTQCARNRNITLYEKIVERMVEQDQFEMQTDTSHFFVNMDLWRAILNWDNVDAMRALFRNRWKKSVSPHEESICMEYDASNVQQYFIDSGLSNQTNVLDTDFLDNAATPPLFSANSSWTELPDQGNDIDEDNGDDDDDDSW